MRPSSAYLICCCERTGSTLLGNALIDTGIAGRPRSYFNRAAHFNPQMQRLLGNARDDDTYLDRVITTATTPNGVFGAKVHWAHFLNLLTKADAAAVRTEHAVAMSVHERLQTHLPDLRYVHLTRKNAVARAISHYRARKTNRWQEDTRRTADDSGGEGEPGFDFDQIDAFVRAGETEDRQWCDYFQQHQISPLELTYEDMVPDLGRTVRRVLAFLGLQAGPIDLPPPSLRVQSDGRSREWEARYRRMLESENS